jgi:glycosyltransferase involved in cell wall biosynthesis
MKVLIASTIVPFVEGGGTLIVDWLDQVLRSYGHEVDVIKIPFWSSHRDMLGQMLALRLLDVADKGDRMIAIRTPSYLIQHPQKVLWFIHHHRGAYDLWGTVYQDIPDTPEGRAYREAIIISDHLAFSEARSIFTNSAVVSKRLKDYNDVDSRVLYPPVFAPERYRAGQYGDYILYVSRITGHKRQILAVQSMQFTLTPVKLLIAGRGDSHESVLALEAEIERCNVRDKVVVDCRWITEKEKIDYFADCLASIYIPFDEDSYGYPSLESYHAGKCVITATDAGGTSELIQDGINGFVVEPAPQAIAAAMDKLYSDRRLARDLGQAGAPRLDELGITWSRVVEKLLA